MTTVCYSVYYFSMEVIKTHGQLSSEGKLFSVSMHPSKDGDCFVAGGEDFKLYKYSLQDGKEIGD